jgi:hypothetical protein
MPYRSHYDGRGGEIMGKRVGMEVSIAAAEAVRQANVDVVSAYPITPQTHIVEHLSDLVANGEMDAEFFCVESEHSALSVCVGSQATGARSFTCTSSQGLALMSEITYIASGLRLPIVMVIANRTLSSPLGLRMDSVLYGERSGGVRSHLYRLSVGGGSECASPCDRQYGRVYPEPCD